MFIHYFVNFLKNNDYQAKFYKAMLVINYFYSGLKLKAFAGIYRSGSNFFLTKPLTCMV